MPPKAKARPRPKSKSQPKRRKSRRNRRSRPSPLKTILRGTVNLISTLPGVPSIIRSVSSWVGKFFGLTVSVPFMVAGTKYISINDGSMYGTLFAGLVRSNALIVNSNLGAFDEAKAVISTNVRSIRPTMISFTLRPTNIESQRNGMYYMCFLPVVGPDSVKDYKALDYQRLSDSAFFKRAPVSARFSADRGGTMCYNVPAHNSYMNRGIPLKVYQEATADSVHLGLLILWFENFNRKEYSAFNADSLSFDMRITGNYVPAEIDPVTNRSVDASPKWVFTEIFKSDDVTFVSKDAAYNIPFKNLTWNETTHAYTVTNYALSTNSGELDDYAMSTNE